MTNVSGRKPGYVMSEKSRKQSSLNNPTSVKVSTPMGDFNSIRQAAKTLKISANLVSYYCQIGEMQRNGESLVNKLTGGARIDYTQWRKVS